MQRPAFSWFYDAYRAVCNAVQRRDDSVTNAMSSQDLDFRIQVKVFDLQRILYDYVAFV